MSKRENYKTQLKVAQMTQECDNLATRYWRLEASSRGRGYKAWLRQIKKVSDFIDIYVSK